MKKTITLLVGGALLLAPTFASALTSVEADKCSTKGIQKGMTKFIAAKLKVLGVCVQNLEKCDQLTDAGERSQCITYVKNKLALPTTGHCSITTATACTLPAVGCPALETCIPDYVSAKVKGGSCDAVTVGKSLAASVRKAELGFAKDVAGQCKIAAAGDMLDDANFSDLAASGSNKLGFKGLKAECAAYGVDLDAGTVDGLGKGACIGSKSGGLLCSVATDCEAPVTDPVTNGALEAAGKGVCKNNSGGRVLICTLRAMEAKVEELLREAHPRAWKLFSAAGLSNAASAQFRAGDDLVIGSHKMSGITDATLRAGGGAVVLGLTNIVTEYTVEVGKADSNGVHDVKVPIDSINFSPILLTNAAPAIDLTVCVANLTDGQGKLCCNSAGCPSMVDMSYEACQDHDTSAANAPFEGDACLGGGPATYDLACTAFSTNQVSPLLPSSVTTSIKESTASPVAKNANAIGGGNDTAHYPRCSGLTGTLTPLNKKYCDSAFGPAQCAGATCSQTSSAGALAGAPCNGPVRVTTSLDPAADGEMVLAQNIQFTLHPNSADLVTAVPGAERVDLTPYCGNPALGQPSCGTINCTRCSDNTNPSPAGCTLPAFCLDGTCTAAGSPCCNTAQLCTGWASPSAAVGCVTFVAPGVTLCAANAGTCVGVADNIADGFGCDGLPCTDDDVTTPNNPSAVAFTTGTASAVVQDEDLAPGPLVFGPFSVSGVTPSNACAQLSTSVTSGYTLAGAFPALDGSQLGDSATTVQQKWN